MIRKPEPASNRSSWFTLAGAASVIILIAALWFSTRPQPQMKFDEDVFNTVDALFTAVTSRDSERLADCATRLTKYQEESRLTGSAAVALNGIVARAQSGEWDVAGKKLYAFILGQRRAS